MRRDQPKVSLGHTVAIEELRSKTPDVANALEQIEQFGLELSRTRNAACQFLRRQRAIDSPFAEQTFGFRFDRCEAFKKRFERWFPETSCAKSLDACDNTVDPGEPRTQALQTPTLAVHAIVTRKRKRRPSVLGRPSFSRLSIVFESCTVKRHDGAVESYEEVPRLLPATL